MNIDYSSLDQDVLSGAFRQNLQEELTFGFRILRQEGERLPLASYYASQIAEIVNRGSATPLHPDFAYHLYQEILSAVEQARESVLAEPVQPSLDS